MSNAPAFHVQSRSLAAIDAAHPPCAFCRGPVIRRTNEARGKWLQRQTCSPLCCSRLLAMIGVRRSNPNATEAHAPCAICAGPVDRDPGEPSWNYARRKTCRHACAQALRQRNIVARSEGQGWPEITAPTISDTPFAAGDLGDPGDGGPLLVSRPATHIPVAGVLG